jgi:hypothetical protein
MHLLEASDKLKHLKHLTMRVIRDLHARGKEQRPTRLEVRMRLPAFLKKPMRIISLRCAPAVARAGLALLEPGLDMLREITGRPVAGVLPFVSGIDG